MAGKSKTPKNRRKSGDGKLRGGLDPSIGQATQFKPGESGNPSGRPRDVAGALARRLFEELESDPKKVLAAMRRHVFRSAASFDIYANRGYGKSSAGDGDKPLVEVRLTIEHIGQSGSEVSVSTEADQAS